MRNPSNFRTGEIYRMKPGYYTTKPYFVEILEVGTFHITTNIPEHHSLRIEFPSLTWDYHIPRMSLYAGPGSSRRVLFNQKLN
jgi:hypothetical protein